MGIFLGRTKGEMKKEYKTSKSFRAAKEKAPEKYFSCTKNLQSGIL